ncbi:MAG: hypothetical protein ACRDCC_02025 [Culicoidibacterales bacterium]
MAKKKTGQEELNELLQLEKEIRQRKKEALLRIKKDNKILETNENLSIGSQMRIALPDLTHEERLNHLKLAIEFMHFHKQYLLDHQEFKKEHFENYKAHITFPNKQGQNNEWFLRQSLNQLPPNYPTPKSEQPETSETKNTINQNQIG